MPRLEFECKPPIPVDGDNVDDREPKPVIKLREGLSVFSRTYLLHSISSRTVEGLIARRTTTLKSSCARLYLIESGYTRMEQ